MHGSTDGRTSAPELEIRDVSLTVDGTQLLDKVSVHVPRGSITAVIGPNGAGKTTLFNVVSGLMKPTAGRIFVRSEDVTSLPTHRIAKLGVGRLFQEVRTFPRLTAIEHMVVALTRGAEAGLLTAFGWQPDSAAEQGERREIHAWLKRVGLEHEAHHLASRMSFGQQKLLSLATILASDSSILLLDEPTSGLAPRMVDLVLERIASSDRTILMIEHDPDRVARVCSRAYVMERGRVTEALSVRELAQQP